MAPRLIVVFPTISLSARVDGTNMRRLSLVILIIVMLSLSTPVFGDPEIQQEVAVHPNVAKYLKEILIKADLDAATISSDERTAGEQASVMYRYYLRAGAPNCPQKTFRERKQCALSSYGSIGRAAIHAVTDVENVPTLIADMTAIIKTEIAQAGDSRNQMMHVTMPGRYAIDVKPSSVANHKRFIKAVLAHPQVIPSRFFWPGKAGGPKESAFHIEFNVAGD